MQSSRTDVERSRQWSDEFSSWVERIDQDFDTMLKLAALTQEWDKIIAEAQQECRLGAAKVAEFDKHIFLAMMRFTTGIAREIVDTSKTAGEAWYPTHRPVSRKECARRDRRCQSTPRVEATYPDCGVFIHLLRVIRMLVREFVRQSPK